MAEQRALKGFNIVFKGLRKDYVLSLLKKNELSVITTVNAEFVVLANENERFKRILNENISTIDGQIPYFFLKLRNPDFKFEKISGSDLIYDICQEASKLNLRVFLLGGLEESNKLSQKKLRELYPSLQIDGYSPAYQPYPFTTEHNESILNSVKKFSPDVLLVAFGAPKQEFWIEDNKDILEKIGVRVAIGVGGTFEFVAGFEKRAPRFIQHIGLESVWRLYQNPKRIKRFLRNFKFLKYIFS